jgi:hypothetical protein
MNDPDSGLSLFSVAVVKAVVFVCDTSCLGGLQRSLISVEAYVRKSYERPA